MNRKSENKHSPTNLPFENEPKKHSPAILSPFLLKLRERFSQLTLEFVPVELLKSFVGVGPLFRFFRLRFFIVVRIVVHDALESV